MSEPRPHELPVTLTEVREAAARIFGEVERTPLMRLPLWSERAGTEVWVKCENLQRTGSFKLRGATNKVRSLIAAATSPLAGVITASSGNHGQAVAYAAKRAGIPCVVVVPETVLAVKEAAIEQYDGEVIHCGTTSSERMDCAVELAEQRGFVFVPPYDDPLVLAGQGTVGLELVEQCETAPGTVIVPIGGGGLTGGTSLAVKSLLPGATVWAAEPELASDTWQSLQAGRIVEIGASTTIADGLRSSHPGDFTFPFVQRYVDDVVLVSERAIADAQLDLLQGAKLVVEPSGAASLAALATVIAGGGRRLEELRSRGPVVCVLSGGNVDPGALAASLLEAAVQPPVEAPPGGPAAR